MASIMYLVDDKAIDRPLLLDPPSLLELAT
jgi:hypothetical protein